MRFIIHTLLDFKGLYQNFIQNIIFKKVLDLANQVLLSLDVNRDLSLKYYINTIVENFDIYPLHYTLHMLKRRIRIGQLRSFESSEYNNFLNGMS